MNPLCSHRLARAGVLALLLTWATPAAATKLQMHWQDTFTEAERQRLITWIERTDAALTELVGPSPLQRHVFFYRTQHPTEPVPWAHTERGARQGVHFYVDPSHSLDTFLNDWTAPHELSHLVIPYLGKRYAWLAEGFASFMQYQVMSALGVMQPGQLETRYRQRFERAAGEFARNANLQTLPFAAAARSLRQQGQYPTMYWGGAVFFWKTDRWLKQHAGTDLSDTLRAFLLCCRTRVKGVDALVTQLDHLAGTMIFTNTLREFREQPGFPVP